MKAVRITGIVVGGLVAIVIGAIALYPYLYFSTISVENMSAQQVLVTSSVKYGYETRPIAKDVLISHQSKTHRFIVKGDGELWMTCRSSPDGASAPRNLGYVTSGIALRYEVKIVTCNDIKLNVAQ